MSRVTHDLGDMGEVFDIDFGTYGEAVTVTFLRGSVRRTVRVPLELLANLVSATKRHADFLDRRSVRLRKFAVGEDCR